MQRERSSTRLSLRSNTKGPRGVLLAYLEHGDQEIWVAIEPDAQSAQ